MASLNSTNNALAAGVQQKMELFTLDSSKPADFDPNSEKGYRTGE